MLETGTILQDRFVIDEPLGRGGMGAVYIAIDRKFGSRVAIKERAYEDPELAWAFEREARLLNNLHHPILPHVSDYFVENGGHFLVMEYIEGEDLSEIIKREGAFPADDVIRWALELLDGLDYLHSQDPPIIHRDIKPPNLKITSRGNIVLLDFGLAKETSGGAQGVRSVFGYSRRYSPLEQIEGVGTDARSDIFSLGATVYHLLTGEPPVDVLARASAIVAGKPDPLQTADQINENVPRSIANIINSALALNSDRRFANAKAMSLALLDAFENGKAIGETAAVENQQLEHGEVEAPAATAIGNSHSPDSVRAGRVVGRRSRIPLAERLRHRLWPVGSLTDLSWLLPSAIAGAVMLGLILLSYFIWRSGDDTETRPMSRESQAIERPVADTVESQHPAVVQQDNDQPSVRADNEQKIKTRENTDAHDSKAEETEAMSRGVRRDAPGYDSRPSFRKLEPQRSVRRTSPSRRAATAEVLARPRIVVTDAYDRPPISMIETIMTGLRADRRGARKP